MDGNRRRRYRGSPHRRRTKRHWVWPWVLGVVMAAGIGGLTFIGFAALGVQAPTLTSSSLASTAIPSTSSAASYVTAAVGSGHHANNTAVGWNTSEHYLHLYHHYADFTTAQCQFLPLAYVGGCLSGARAQARANHGPDPISERKRLFAAYTHGARFNRETCTLLPTDSVAECLARFPAERPNRGSTSRTAP